MTNSSLNFVIQLALILLLSTLPSFAYLLIFRKAKKRWQTRLRRAQIITAYRSSARITADRDYDYDDSYLLSDRHTPVTKYFIGDTSCANNARSPYIRCAINPCGPCEDCRHYEKRYHSQND